MVVPVEASHTCIVPSTMEAIRDPSGDHAENTSLLTLASCAKIPLPVVAFQTTNPETIRLPSGDHTAISAFLIKTRLPVVASHICTVLPSPEAIRCPSGDHATERIGSV